MIRKISILLIAVITFGYFGFGGVGGNRSTSFSQGDSVLSQLIGVSPAFSCTTSCGESKVVDGDGGVTSKKLVCDDDYDAGSVCAHTTCKKPDGIISSGEKVTVKCCVSDYSSVVGGCGCPTGYSSYGT